MELILQGWLDTDNCGNIGLKNSKNDYSWNCESLSYLIMDYFDYMRIDEGLGSNVDDLIIGGHNLDYELKQHIGQYIHFILTD